MEFKNLLFPAFVILYILPKVVRGDRKHESILRRSQKFYESPGKRNLFLFFVETRAEQRTSSKSGPSRSASSRSPSRRSPKHGLASTKGVQRRARRYIRPTFCFISDWLVAKRAYHEKRWDVRQAFEPCFEFVFEELHVL